VSKKVKKSKTPKAPNGRGGNGGGKDLITGIWSLDGSEVVTLTVTSNNTDYKTYFGVIEDANGSGDFGGYADSNRNGVFDAGIDTYVGSASLSVFGNTNASRGTFDASRTTGIGNGYVGNTLVGVADGAGYWFGRQKTANQSGSKGKSGPSNPSKGKTSTKVDIVTGTWSLNGDDVVILSVTSNNTPYKTYFGVVGDYTGRGDFGGYADSNRNGRYDAGVDIYVGGASLSVYDNTSASRGTFDASRSTGVGNGYVGNTLVGVADGAGFWFS